MNKFFYIILLFLILNSLFSKACTIFTASNKNTVLVGNNEDNTPNLRSFLWFYPAVKNKYGYVTWGNVKKLPEGGMNEKGLFWDAAAMPQKIAIIVDENKEKYNGYFVEKALAECATVDELIILISKFNLMWQEKAQILVADATGDFAIIHANYVIRKFDINKNYFSLANYCLNNPNISSFQCHRQGYAENILGKKPKLSIELFKNILQKTAQTDIGNATLYSQICDLKKGNFYLFQKYDFEFSKVLNLKEELQKGLRMVEIKTYFSTNIADEILTFFDKKEYAKATEAYEYLLKTKADSINFSFRYLDELGYKYLREKKNETAIEVFKLNLKYNQNYANGFASLACGYLANTDTLKARQYFAKARSINPQNYLANLFYPRKKGIIMFYLNHFEGVKKLSLVGSFNDYKIGVNPFVKDKNNIWTCSITLKPNEYSYKLVVGDGNWYTDPLNKYLVKPDKYWDNYLKVE